MEIAGWINQVVEDVYKLNNANKDFPHPSTALMAEKNLTLANESEVANPAMHFLGQCKEDNIIKLGQGITGDKTEVHWVKVIFSVHKVKESGKQRERERKAMKKI